MSSNPIKIILNSSNWDDFEKSLYNLGNSPENKKIKGDAFEYFTKFFRTSPIIFSRI